MDTENSKYPISADDIRKNLIDRALAYSEAAKVSLSSIGTDAVNDSKFLARVRDGKGFTIASYERVMDWLEKAEQELEPAE